MANCPAVARSHDYADPLKAVSYALVDSVSKGLNYLVLANAGSASIKAEKARAQGIAVISEEELEKLIGQGSDAQAFPAQ